MSPVCKSVTENWRMPISAGSRSPANIPEAPLFHRLFFGPESRFTALEGITMQRSLFCAIPSCPQRWMTRHGPIFGLERLNKPWVMPRPPSLPGNRPPLLTQLIITACAPRICFSTASHLPPQLPITLP